MTGQINNKYYLHDFIDDYRKNLKSEIERLEITDQSDVDEIYTDLVESYTIIPITVGEPQPSAPKETYIDKKGIWENETYRQKVYEIKVDLPFTGEKQLFDCRPSTCKVIYLDNKFYINSSSFTFWVLLEELDAAKYQAEVSKFKSGISANLDLINSEVEKYNNSLGGTIKSLINQRSRTVSQKFDFMEKIGLQVSPKADSYMVPSPIAKKQIPAPVLNTQTTAVNKVVPILKDNVYEDIKIVLYNVGRAMERKPSLYINKYEEDLRDVFLLFLETRYDSTTGVGEAFNKKGKTDILLKYAKDGSNLFVAECKFWKGQKKMFEAVDQLLSYLTHRDSKTAIMTFVDQKEFTTVINTFRTEIHKHLNFNKYIGDSYGSSISYYFTLPSDSKSLIQIEFMFFHFPK